MYVCMYVCIYMYAFMLFIRVNGYTFCIVSSLQKWIQLQHVQYDLKNRMECTAVPQVQGEVVQEADVRMLHV